MGRLREYLEHTRQEGESAYERFDRFGAQIGVTGSCVRKWLYRQRSINDTMKRKIVAATNGCVSYEDLFKNNIFVQSTSASA